MKLKIFYFNRGGEFITLKLFFQKNNIIFKKSALYIYNQNDVSKRAIQIITKKARIILFAAKLPLNFQGYIINTAVYITNQ